MPMSRFALFAASIGILFLPACKDDAHVNRVDRTSDGRARSNERVVLLSWEDYFSPEVISQFENEFKMEVEFVFFSNVEEMKARLQSGPDAHDLVIADGGTIGSLIELQMLQSVRREEIPHFANLDPRYLNQAFDPGNRFSIPYMWGTTLIAYRNDLIPEPKRSWGALWDGRYIGRVAMLDEQTDSFAAALLSLGLDMNSENPSELKAATEALLGQVNRVGARFVDFKTAEELLVSGDCWMCMTYSSDAATIAETNENVSYFVPEEGSPIWLDSFAIPREAKNVENAHVLMNFLARAEVAAVNANFLWGATANRAALPSISPDLANDEALYPKGEILARCQFLSPKSAVHERLTNQGMKLVYDAVQVNEGKAVRQISIGSKSAGEPDEGGPAVP